MGAPSYRLAESRPNRANVNLWGIRQSAYRSFPVYASMLSGYRPRIDASTDRVVAAVGADGGIGMARTFEGRRLYPPADRDGPGSGPRPSDTGGQRRRM